VTHEHLIPDKPADRVIVFDVAGDFNAMRAAEHWCAEHGISVGRQQRGSPRGLLRGSWDIQKWRNLNAQERRDLDGTMTGDMKSGPVTIRMKAGR
jgi:hypothetical protein